MAILCLTFWELPILWVNVSSWKLSGNLSLFHFHSGELVFLLTHSAFYMYYPSSSGFNYRYCFYLISFFSVWFFPFALFKIFCLWCDTAFIIMCLRVKFLQFNSIYYALYLWIILKKIKYIIIKENYLIVSIVTEKSFDKIKQLLTKRKQNKMNKQGLGTEAFFLNFTKGIFLKTTENSIINSEVRVIP